MPTCAVYLCKTNTTRYNYANDGVSFHRFPKNAELKSKWITAAGRCDEWFPTKYSIVCSKHFPDGNYIYKERKRYLHPDAVPTLLLTMCPDENCHASKPVQTTDLPDKSHAVEHCHTSTTQSPLPFMDISNQIFKIYPKLHIPSVPYMRSDRGGKSILLILLTLFWGMEIGFKFASRTVIYLLNPCHVTTAIQIYLLSAPPSKTVTAVFRFHLNLLNGPLLAFLFPETASRKIPMEAALYWIQHGLMCIIPYYLLRIGGVYNVEALGDLNWSVFSYCINTLYHFVFLQVFAIPAQVNLNHMLCPAILDPFDGPWYRVAALIHQALLCPLLCKLYCLLADYCLTSFPLTKVKPNMSDDLPPTTKLCH